MSTALKAPSAYTIEAVLSVALAAKSRAEAMGVDLTAEGKLFALLSADGAPDVELVLRRLIVASIAAGRMVKMIEDEERDLGVRKARYKGRQELWRGSGFAVADALRLPGHTAPEYTMTISPGRPRKREIDINKLPPEFITEVVTKVANEAAIDEALADGLVIDGVRTDTGNGPPVMTVRPR